MHNPANQVAEVFRTLADLLEIDGANPFRIRAYRKGADTITALGSSILEHRGQLTSLAGIGKDLAGKIEEILDTGTLPLLEETAARVPLSLRQIARIRGLGPKRTAQLFRERGITTLDQLRVALETDALSDLDGFGPTLLKKIRTNLPLVEQHATRTLWHVASKEVEPLMATLRAAAPMDSLDVAGSYRRRRETVGDLDLLAVSTEPEQVLEAFQTAPGIGNVEAAGSTKSTAYLDSGLQVDLRVVPADALGAALIYFTGSKEHNILLRERAQKRGLRLNEYGLFREDDTRLDANTEEAIYAALDLAWVPPELRTGTDELVAAAAGATPTLVTADDLRGDLHMHTTWSDGKGTLEAMAAAAVARGHDYIAITDHSPLMPMVNGLDGERLAQQAEAIAALDTPLHILRGIECDIRRDGTLDLPDDVLAELDLVVCAIHTHLDLELAEQTDRLLRAMENPHFMVWAHPTSRLLLQRAPIAFDRNAVLDTMADLNIAIEINAQPNRLDADPDLLRAARDRFIPVVISTDAHRTHELAHQPLGVHQARRAGLSPQHVLNTRPLEELRGLLRPR